MKKIIVSLALLISLSTACSQSGSIVLVSFDSDGLTFLPSRNPTPPQRDICTAQHNLLGERSCQKMLQDLQKIQAHTNNLDQKLTICHKSPYCAPVCLTSHHATTQTAIQTLIKSTMNKDMLELLKYQISQKYEPKQSKK